jgi:hypothetical protein
MWKSAFIGLLSGLGAANAQRAYSECASDVNADTKVNVQDLLLLLSSFGQTDCAVTEGGQPSSGGYAIESPNTAWRQALNPPTCPEACIRQGMDYGGNPVRLPGQL